MAAHDSCLIVIGGLNPSLSANGASRALLHFDVETLQWSAVSLRLELPVTRCSAVMIRWSSEDDLGLSSSATPALVVVSARPLLTQIVWLTDGRVETFQQNLLMEDGGLAAMLDSHAR